MMALTKKFCLFLTLVSLVQSFSPHRLNTAAVQRKSSLSYRTGDEEMDVLINSPADVEYLEYRRSVFNPRNRQQNKEKAMEKRKYLEWELIVGRFSMVLFTVMIVHELLTGEKFFYGP